MPRPRISRSRCRCRPTCRGWTPWWRGSKACRPMCRCRWRKGGDVPALARKAGSQGRGGREAEDGWPALVRAGGLHYLAGWPDDQALTRILQRACASAKGSRPIRCPRACAAATRATHRFLFNYNAGSGGMGRGNHPAGRGAGRTSDGAGCRLELGSSRVCAWDQVTDTRHCPCRPAGRQPVRAQRQPVARQDRILRRPDRAHRRPTRSATARRATG